MLVRTCMAIRILQQIGGNELQLDEQVMLVLAIIVMLIGVLLAFAGARIWKSVMSFIGSVIFGIIGFTIGTVIGGMLMGFVLGGLAGLVGGMLFVFLARVGIGVVAGVLFYIVVAGLSGNQVVGLVAGLVGFVVAFVYIETTVGIVTAVLGGILVGLGLYLLDYEMLVVLLAMLVTMVFGGAVQMTFLKDKKRPAQVLGEVPPPPPPD